MNQDLEEIEEWNEFGELRMVVNSAPDLDGMPATSYPAPAAQPPKEPEPKTPKPSTIKIQSPPSTKTDEPEKKDSTAVLALRQASAEAASKAKSKTEDKKEPKTEIDRTSSTSPSTKHRKGSVAPELPDTAPDSPKGAKRPALVPEMAAVSSANFHADNAEMLGLVEHHRGSIISEGNKEEHDKAVHEIRASISKEDPAGSIAALRKEAAEKDKRPSETIEESPLAEDATEEKPVEDKKEEKEGEKLETKSEAKEGDEEKDAKPDTKETKEEPKEEPKEESKEIKEGTSAADPAPASAPAETTSAE